MNLKYYFTEKQVRSILASPKKSLKKLREGVRTAKVSNRWLYNRQDVLEYAQEKARLKITKLDELASMKHQLVQMAETVFPPIDLDLTNYIPRAEALALWPFSHEWFYLNTTRRKVPTIAYIKIDGFYLYNKQDILTVVARKSQNTN